jgi:hypothetical protein
MVVGSANDSPKECYFEVPNEKEEKCGGQANWEQDGTVCLPICHRLISFLKVAAGDIATGLATPCPVRWESLDNNGA